MILKVQILLILHYIKLVEVGERKAKLEIDIQYKKTGVVKRCKKQIKLGNELKELTNGRELYNNYLIQDRCHKKVSYKIQIRKV